LGEKWGTPVMEAGTLGSLMSAWHALEIQDLAILFGKQSVFYLRSNATKWMFCCVWDESLARCKRVEGTRAGRGKSVMLHSFCCTQRLG